MQRFAANDVATTQLYLTPGLSKSPLILRSCSVTASSPLRDLLEDAKNAILFIVSLHSLKQRTKAKKANTSTAQMSKINSKRPNILSVPKHQLAHFKDRRRALTGYKSRIL